MLLPINVFGWSLKSIYIAAASQNKYSMYLSGGSISILQWPIITLIYDKHHELERQNATNEKLIHTLRPHTRTHTRTHSYTARTGTRVKSHQTVSTSSYQILNIMPLLINSKLLLNKSMCCLFLFFRSGCSIKHGDEHQNNSREEQKNKQNKKIGKKYKEEAHHIDNVVFIYLVDDNYAKKL